MDVVRVFNNELSSLYEVKPPISKAKMTQITKCAIKGIKFYKHIVQSVEKFIQKCRPEYKVPGLYVVDSIVRQSRHQFGADKDVFAPRFTKNVAQTFANLFKCADEDRPKIVRVLNLWQKNSVFPSDVIQPLLDMANPNSAGEWGFDAQAIMAEDSPVRKAISQSSAAEIPIQNSKSKSAELSSWKGWPQGFEESTDESHNYSEITTKNLEKFTKANYSSSVMPDPVQVPQAKTHKSAELIPEENTVLFNKKLLDFDYGDEEDEEEVKTDENHMPSAPNPLALSMAQNLLSNPELLRQLQQMQQTIQQNEALKSELAMQPQVPPQKEIKECYSPEPPDNDSMSMNAVPYPDHQPNTMPYPPHDNYPLPYTAPLPPPQLPISEPKMPMDMAYQHPMMPDDEMLMQSSQVDEDDRMIYSMPGEPPLPPQDLDERAIVLPTIDERIRKECSRSRSGSRSRGRSGRHRSRSRSPRRRKSRSRSRSRSRRNRSRSRERERERERQREKERERERERERRKKGIPPVKKNCITVCSTTLWLGHVPKTCSEIDISSTFSDFGQILTIDMIPPRGCAYVVMDRRQDAHRALQKLKNLKIQSSSIKMAWAPGKGVKGKEFKDYWEVDCGVSYIPFDKVPPNDLQILDLLEDGGFIDEESLPQSLRDVKKQHEKEKAPVNNEEHIDKHQEIVMPQPPSGPTSMMPNTSMGMPMVLPQMMQPQFGMPLPGLLPPQSMVVQMPVAVPPPSQLMMVQPPAQTLLAGTPLPVGSIPQMPHMSLPHPTLPPSSVSMSNIMSNLEPGKDRPAVPPTTSSSASGDATPTDEDGTSVSSPNGTSTGQSVSTSSGPSVSSLPSMGTQVSAGQFNPVMAHHGMSRPLLPVLPPVSSAGTPIPFPPPQVGFGFPPPPLRPGVPNQNLPGVIPMPNSFPWLHKTSAPGYGGFSDSDMRFTSALNSSAVNMRPPLINQPSGHPSSSINNQLGSEHSRSQSSSKDLGHKSSTTSQKDKNASGAENAKSFNNRMNSNQAHTDMFGRQSVGSPKSFDRDHDMVPENQEDVMPPDFPRELEMGMIPRFPGPPDFHPARGALRGHWMPGPAQRFPRNIHPGVPFPPRVPRMDMEFFHHQIPPGPRMHIPGPRGQQPMWGGNGFPPPRMPDRFPNRREYYDEPHFQEEEERRFAPREDRSCGRESREEPEKRSDEEKKPVKSVEGSSKPMDTGTKSEDRERNIDLVPKVEDKSIVNQKTNVPVNKPLPKPAQKVDLTFDLFRLQNYGNRCKKPSFKANLARTKREEQKKAANRMSSKCEDSMGATETNNEEPKVESSDAHKDRSTELVVNSCDGETKNEDKVEQLESGVSENRSRRDRADRKRSRWGRTLSQEREFQQQRINEIEMKFQNFESQHQTSENSNINGSLSGDQTSISFPQTANEGIAADVANSAVVDETAPIVNNSAILQNDHDFNQNVSLVGNDFHSDTDGEKMDSSTSDSTKPTLSDIYDSASAQVTLAS